ncbi:MAG TPA: TrbI/VirB10 family protein [Gemmatimonadaceae bacterium]|jgi:type IV secretory pathway VirB10-like protein|nr:TrbI/VirB10 family protein [Gemmatimonadaceae bacterium]
MTLRPRPPVATRLNRVALGVIGVLVTITAAVGVHYIAGSGAPVATAAADSVVAVTVPQHPSFPEAVGDSMARSPASRTVATVASDTMRIAADTIRIVPRATAQVAAAPMATTAYGRALHSALIVALDSSMSSFTLTAGTVLAATLVTQITSDLPGTVVAQLTRDAYDSRTGRFVLIPKGTRLIGRYDSRVSAGQRRMLVTWTRLIFPDARELALPDLAAVDEHGAAGLADAVDNHLPRVFGTALALSAVGAGAQLSQPSGGSALVTPSAGQVAAGALGQQMSGTATDVLRRAADIPPTITVRAGFPFDLLLAHDLALPGPYADSRR